MSEIEVKRWERRLTSRGVNKKLASEIIYTAWESGKGKRFEMFVEYAVVLNYGSNLKINNNKCNI